MLIYWEKNKKAVRTIQNQPSAAHTLHQLPDGNSINSIRNVHNNITKYIK